MTLDCVYDPETDEFYVISVAERLYREVRRKFFASAAVTAVSIILGLFVWWPFFIYAMVAGVYDAVQVEKWINRIGVVARLEMGWGLSQEFIGRLPVDLVDRLYEEGV